MVPGTSNGLKIVFHISDGQLGVHENVPGVPQEVPKMTNLDNWPCIPQSFWRKSNQGCRLAFGESLPGCTESATFLKISIPFDTLTHKMMSCEATNRQGDSRSRIMFYLSH